jgi:hypothetical protein
MKEASHLEAMKEARHPPLSSAWRMNEWVSAMGWLHIERTIPQKPKSRLPRYLLTAKGRMRKIYAPA